MKIVQLNDIIAPKPHQSSFFFWTIIHLTILVKVVWFVSLLHIVCVFYQFLRIAFINLVAISLHTCGTHKSAPFTLYECGIVAIEMRNFQSQRLVITISAKVIKRKTINQQQKKQREKLVAETFIKWVGVGVNQQNSASCVYNRVLRKRHNIDSSFLEMTKQQTQIQIEANALANAKQTEKHNKKLFEFHTYAEQPPSSLATWRKEWKATNKTYQRISG